MRRRLVPSVCVIMRKCPFLKVTNQIHLPEDNILFINSFILFSFERSELHYQTKTNKQNQPHYVIKTNNNKTTTTTKKQQQMGKQKINKK